MYDEFCKLFDPPAGLFCSHAIFFYSNITTPLLTRAQTFEVKFKFIINFTLTQVYSTSVAMLLTAVVSVFLFGFHLSLAFFLGTVVVSVAIYLHSAGKMQR
ncbi:unnamed protein product [Sphenostylis stenocarpa]|uniref:Uncharacterized protein n=1 Tax=Sphenostylis stenocarpa TaxID=92480 RepID=A0AA86SS87_9FABA|nr:unnamed protein product [Sphenostylis stenocarpa]